MGQTLFQLPDQYLSQSWWVLKKEQAPSNMVVASTAMYLELAMSMVTLKLPEVKDCQQERQQRCPYCSGETFQRWGGEGKRVIDPQLGEVWVYCYRCRRSRRTFRQYPVRGYKTWSDMAAGWRIIANRLST
ncbi:hypothetical protein [Anaerolinea thermolimosa]|uniref:hypothetical protein n=1 Tax=Anaerolinea thermolimosa TaxID=229919 RepID=UPI00191C8F97|nr:hypothetical protein [Anaerolinea thermolimosa]